MKKKICFGGFAEAEVQSLRTTLAEVSGGWEWTFVPDAEAVLSLLAAEPIAALVADVRIDGLGGAELLQQAAALSPRTLRFALGELADRELIVNSIGAPYQFISRPWKGPELVAAIERSLAFDAWLSTDALRAFIPRLGRLPGLPATYFEVLKRVESPHASVESVAEVIARDPALTARLLQMVNSASSGLREKITSPAEGVSVLGLDVVKSLVLCLQVFNESETPNPSLSLDRIWRHSFSVARLARHIGAVHSISTSDAYAAGLLHRIGQIVLATNLCKEYGEVVAAAREQRQTLAEAELGRLGVTSSQVGAYLLGLWGMPLPLVEAAALYLTPSLSTTREFSLLTAVHVADVLASEEGHNPSGFPLPVLDRKYLTELGLPYKPDAWRKLLAAATEAAPVRQGGARQPAAERREPVAAPSPSGGARFMKLALAAGLVLALALGAAHWLGFPSAVADLTATEHEPAPLPPSAAEGLDEDSPLAAVKLEGIFYSANRSTALINGRTLSPGESLNGVKLVSIQRSSVVVQAGRERKTLRLR